MPAQGRPAASSSVRCSGTRTTASAGTHISLASTPSTSPPSARWNFSGAGGPLSQPWKNIGHTRSPTRTLAIPSPTATTSPTPSETGISGSV
jgi:hypothetical protein